jgi:hypothetical protein
MTNKDEIIKKLDKILDKMYKKYCINDDYYFDLDIGVT